MRVAADPPAEIMRPFLWVAAIGFSTGFLGYLAFGVQMIQSA